MTKFTELISGVVKVYETDSVVNGHVEVVRDLFGTSIKCDGLTQSGDLIEKIWKKPLKQVHSTERKVHSVLILGLGGGSTAKLIRKYWPTSEIIGVDLDPIMIDLGKKYLKLDDYKVKIIVTDAYTFVKNYSLLPSAYDLVLVDVYQGRSVPEVFDSEDFAKMIKKILADNGVAVFNRLYAGGVRSQAIKFMHKLEKVFASVDPVYPMANVMFITSK